MDVTGDARSRIRVPTPRLSLADRVGHHAVVGVVGRNMTTDRPACLWAGCAVRNRRSLDVPQSAGALRVSAMTGLLNTRRTKWWMSGVLTVAVAAALAMAPVAHAADDDLITDGNARCIMIGRASRPPRLPLVFAGPPKPAEARSGGFGKLHLYVRR